MTDAPHRLIRAPHRYDRRRLLAEAPRSAGNLRDAHAGLPVLAELDADRRLRGPYTMGGELLRAIVPAALRRWPELVAAHETEILSLAPELRGIVPATRETLTSLAVPRERTRFYSRLRTWRIAHGVTEFVQDHVRRLGGGPYLLLVDGVHHADATDRELLAVLLRRADPGLLRLRLALAGELPADPPGPSAEPLASALARHTAEAEPEEEAAADEGTAGAGSAQPPPLPAGDPAEAYVRGDCADDDPRLLGAYRALAPAARAALHDARADELAAAGEPSLLLGALPFHREHGSDPAGAGADALRLALDTCVDLGFYHATVDLGRRGRALVDQAGSLDHWWAFTTKTTTSLSALGRPDEALELYEQVRAESDNPMLHMQAAYATAMIHTRYLEREAQDHAAARRWCNAAIAYAQWIPDPTERAFQTAFHRNGLALVAVHEGRPEEALGLVTDGITRLDRALGDAQHGLHRSVLRHNRSQLHLGLGRYQEALADLDAVLDADPHYPEYHFDRGNLLRRMGRPEEAVACYERAARLSPPFPEVVYNRADARLEIGETDAALADFGYVIELDPGCVDAYVNRAGLLYAAGESVAARADVAAGLALAPDNPHLLCLHGQLTAADDPASGHAALTALVGAHPGYPPGWAARAALAYERGRLTDAVRDFDRALELADDPGYRFNRGMTRLALGDPEAARADLAASFDGSGDPETLLHVAACLLDLGRPDQAEAVLRDCTRADPGLTARAGEILARASATARPGGS